MDTLSDVLRSVRLTGAVFFDIDACDPWVAETPTGASIARRIIPGAEHLIPYHAVARGACWVGLLDEPPVHVTAGDIVVLPQGDAHVLSSAPGMRAAPDMALYRAPRDRQLPFAMSMGTAGSDPAHIVCGYLGCDARPFNPLLSALPRLMRVVGREGGAAATFMAFAVAESQTPRMGGECVLGRLSELMFVDAVRRYLEELPPDHANWLAGLRDPYVGRALAALHASPSDDWDLESLCRAVGLSRSALVERFTRFVGLPPMQYLANWRMQVAASHLRSGTESIAAIAGQVGYESEAAFSRAFKRAVGIPPSEWRRRGVTDPEGPPGLPASRSTLRPRLPPGT